MQGFGDAAVMGGMFTLALGLVEVVKVLVGKVGNGNGSRAELDRERWDGVRRSLDEHFKELLQEVRGLRKDLTDRISRIEEKVG